MYGTEQSKVFRNRTRVSGLVRLPVITKLRIFVHKKIELVKWQKTHKEFFEHNFGSILSQGIVLLSNYCTNTKMGSLMTEVVTVNLKKVYWYRRCGLEYLFKLQ
jgi:hypothetical protein